MIILALRSSSISSFRWCQHKLFLASVLGLPDPPGKKALLGTAVHKSLELLAQQKRAAQRGEAGFRDDEIGFSFTETLEPDDALRVAFNHYRGPDWSEKDWWDCRSWMWNVLRFNGGQFDPRNLDIIAPEQYFDITIDEPWAAYDYALPDGNRLKGQLTIRGTMDLLVREGDSLLHYIDYKTGRRVNWANEKEKGYDDFRDDPQFLIYYWALSKLYPADEVIFTVYYCRDGGPFTVYFDREDVPRAERVIRSYYEEIRDCTEPALIWPSWKCRICVYNQPWQGGEKSTCFHMRDELIQLGMDRVTAKYGGDLKQLTAYSGGGRTNK